MTRPALLLALALALTGCSGGIPGGLVNAGADVRPVRMTDLRSDFAPFSADPRYDYLSYTADAPLDAAPDPGAAAVRYHVVGDAQFDGVFYRSAVLAGQFHLLSETMTRYRSGELSLSDSEDAAFLSVMTAQAIDTLPNMLGEARTLLSEVRSLDTGRLSTLQKLRAAQGSAQAVQSLQAIIDSGSQVDDVLNDYQALQDDLDDLDDLD